VIGAVDAAILVSHFEYGYVGAHAPSAHRFLIPLAHQVSGRSVGYDRRSGILFVGNFAHAPNVEAVHFLCGTIWPRVREQLPDAELFVVGAGPPSELIVYGGSDGTTIMGHVSDLTDLCGRVRLTVAPLRFGAGLKGKVLFSLAAGLPCVATSVACEGMPEGRTEGVSIADSADAFARAVVQIHSDADRWLAMSDAGVAYAQRNFSIDAVAAKIEALLSSLGLPQRRS